MSDTVLIDRDGDVATLTLNRPAALNAMTPELMTALHDRLMAIADDGAARAVLLTGAGEGFCSGQDLRQTGDDLFSPTICDRVERHYLPIFALIRNMPMPVVAAVNGVAAGGGCSLALACDIVFAARSARFVQVFSRIGIAPDLGSTYIVPRLVGRQRALAMMMTNDPVDAETAAAWGLIWRAVDDDRLMTEALAFAARLAAGPTRALAMTRRLVDAGEAASFEAQFRHEMTVQAGLLASDDAREAVRAFIEKRPARFSGK